MTFIPPDLDFFEVGPLDGVTFLAADGLFGAREEEILAFSTPVKGLLFLPLACFGTVATSR